MQTGRWESFAAFWDDGYRNVFTLRALGVRGERAELRHVLRWLILSTAAPAVGLAAILVADSRSPGNRTSAVIFVATLAIFNAGIFSSAALAWGYVRSKSEAIDEFFVDAPDWAVAVRPLAISYSGRLQSAISVAAAIIPLVLIGFSDVPPRAGYAIVAFVGSFTAFFLANVLLWLLVSPLLILRLTKVQRLRWRWNDPARTPAIRALSSAYGYAAMFVGLAALGVTLPGLFGSTVISDALPLAYVLLLMLALYVGAVTQWGAARIVRRVRLQMLDALVRGSALEGVDVTSVVSEIWMNGEGVQSETLEAYSQIATGRNLPYTSTTVVEYFIVVLGGLVSFLVQVIP